MLHVDASMRARDAETQVDLSVRWGPDGCRALVLHLRAVVLAAWSFCNYCCAMFLSCCCSAMMPVCSTCYRSQESFSPVTERRLPCEAPSFPQQRVRGQRFWWGAKELYDGISCLSPALGRHDNIVSVNSTPGRSSTRQGMVQGHVCHVSRVHRASYQKNTPPCSIPSSPRDARRLRGPFVYFCRFLESPPH